MRPWALAVAACLLLAGCTSPESTTTDTTTLAPQSTGHVLLQLDASGDPAQVALEIADDGGLEVLLPERLHHNDTSAAGWVGIDIPEGASGDHEVVLDVSGATVDQITIPVAVDAGGETLEAGAVALVDVVLRTEDGTLALNSRADVESSALPRSEGYQPAPEPGPMPLTLSPQELPPEILDPLTALAIGHSTTVALPDFFGATQEEQEQPREESIDRRTTLDRFQSMDRQMAQQQGIIDDSTQEGDSIDGGGLSYIVETLNDTTLRLEVDAAEGDRVSFYEPWPEATVVEDRTANEVIFRTDAPTETGERFTWQPDWPDATEVVSTNDTDIVLRHSPEVGTTYQANTQQGPVEQEVTAVDEDAIVITQDNPHPLAGETIFLEATMVGEGDPPQPAIPGQP